MNFEFSASFPLRVAATLNFCSWKCIDGTKSNELIVRYGLDSIYFDFLINLLVYSKSFHIPTSLELLNTNSTCLSSIVPCCLCSNNQPGIIDPQTQACMCECFCDSPNNTIKSYIDPETYVCQCEMCPDQTIQKKKSDGSFWCPCECQDGSIQEQLTDGTCNCTCPCLDGTNDTLSSDGTCSCECMCKNCKKSMRTSYGCYCPAEQFACPNGDKIKWENCLPQCEQRNPCGSYPFCLGDLTGVNCNIPNCPGCKNGFCKKSLAGTCSSLCSCNE